MRELVKENILIDGHRISHGSQGDGDPIVLIHGTPSSSYIWRNVAPDLVAAGYSVHLFDLLGFGTSERPWDAAVDTSVSAQVAILEALLSHWGLDQPHIVAHDIGGAHRLHAAIPGSSLHILPDCGHFAMEDRPAEIANLVKRFLSAH